MKEAKAIFGLGYHKFVLPLPKAVQVLQLLNEAEIYETQWQRGSEQGTTYHVFPNDMEMRLELIPEHKYNVARLAGKPERN
jgi:hypothetical protein